MNKCWNPDLLPASEQATRAALTLGGGTAIGGIGGGTATAYVAATIQPVASTYYALGFIPWGTTMTGLPVGAVIGIAAAGVVGSAALGLSLAYDLRELVLAGAAANSKMLPIAIYNTSTRRWWPLCRVLMV